MIGAATEPRFVRPAQVGYDEMVFAIALFIAAAQGKIALPNKGDAGFSLSSRPDLTSDPMLLGASLVSGESYERHPDEVPLACAVAVVWHHYDHDDRQQAICSRLVAFYSLMARSKGLLLAPWTEGSTIDPGEVILEPAIVEAVATAPTDENGQFDDANFRALVESFAEGRGGRPSPSYQANVSVAQGKPAPLPVTAVVEQLSRHLFAFQTAVATMPDLKGVPRFRVVEQISNRLAAMSGNAGLQSLLSRALRATNSEFPWLQLAKASAAGTLEGLDRIQPPPDIQEAMRGELAVIGSLIELLRSVLGDAITEQLLKSLWPLVALDADVH